MPWYPPATNCLSHGHAMGKCKWNEFQVNIVRRITSNDVLPRLRDQLAIIRHWYECWQDHRPGTAKSDPKRLSHLIIISFHATVSLRWWTLCRLRLQFVNNEAERQKVWCFVESYVRKRTVGYIVREQTDVLLSTNLSRPTMAAALVFSTLLALNRQFLSPQGIFWMEMINLDKDNMEFKPSS